MEDLVKDLNSMVFGSTEIQGTAAAFTKKTKAPKPLNASKTDVVPHNIANASTTVAPLKEKNKAPHTVIPLDDNDFGGF